MKEQQGNTPKKSAGAIRNDVFNREELNNAHVQRGTSTDQTGEDMIDGDNLMART
ncbi:hypothetical protein [Bacillus sp. V5-8f]|uniref:hypothetical protein n=1 Tax=Bacillus sp. V5-8f TaxID=2053044 RepID=UPI0015E0B1A4|nr:hypothetical protein [Bacillus sp. V5-8f]